MEIIGHQAKEVDLGLHFEWLEPSKVPVAGRQGQTNAKAVTESDTHFFDQADEVVGIFRPSSPVRCGWTVLRISFG